MATMDFIRGTPTQNSLMSPTDSGTNYFGDNLRYGAKYSKMLDNGDTGLAEVMRQNLDMGIGFDDSMKLATANRNFTSGNMYNQSADGSGVLGSDWTNSLSDDTFKGVTSLSGPKSDSSWGKWFEDKGNQAMLQTGFGAANLGLGLTSYLQQSDFMKKQGKLLDQQLASNKYEMDRRQGFSNAMAANSRSAG